MSKNGSGLASMYGHLAQDEPRHCQWTHYDYGYEGTSIRPALLNEQIYPKSLHGTIQSNNNYDIHAEFQEEGSCVFYLLKHCISFKVSRFRES